MHDSEPSVTYRLEELVHAYGGLKGNVGYNMGTSDNAAITWILNMCQDITTTSKMIAGIKEGHGLISGAPK